MEIFVNWALNSPPCLRALSGRLSSSSCQEREKEGVSSHTFDMPNTPKNPSKTCERNVALAKKIQARIYKGTRDFLPEQMIKRNYVINIIKNIFEKYGFEPLETPTLELWETLSGKYGEEADRLTYRFIDRGDREVGLRYDLTVPLSRVMAMYPNLPKPFRRYQIQPVWRADKPQKGRFREFYQCDIDIVGSPSMVAEAEIIAISHEILSELNFKDFVIKINNRKILSGLIEVCGVAPEKEIDIYRSMDKLDKVGIDGVKSELEERGIDDTAISRLVDILQIEGNNREKMDQTQTLLANSEIGKRGIEEMREVFEYLSAYQVPEQHILFDLYMARGLDYYTGPIFETVVTKPRIGSLTGGGRYDTLIGMFSGQDIPATGSSVGLERTIAVMEELNMFPPHLSTSTRVLVTVFDETSLAYSLRIANTLREAGINTDLYSGSSKLRGQFGLANDKGIPIVVIAGPDEQAEGKANIKNMRSGEQFTVSIDELVPQIKHILSE